MSETYKNKLALIDGYGFVFRAFHSLPPLTRADGTPVGAVYGFTSMLIKLLANLHVSHIAIVFDSGSKTFRNDLFSAYKANRPECPPELIPQFPIIREVAEALDLAILERVGFEADDLIATVAKQASRENFEVVIVSSDKDLMQLVDGKVMMYDALKNKMIGEKEVEEKFFVKPKQVLDVLSLMGDASDNVPGVRGIGPKTAAELINHYQTLENLLENLHEIKQEKRRQMLIDGVEKARLSKQLITLCETVPVSDNLQDYLLKNIDGRKLMNFLDRQGFSALMARVKRDFKVDDDIQLPLLGAVNDQLPLQNIQQRLPELTKNPTMHIEDRASFEPTKKLPLKAEFLNSSNGGFEQVKSTLISDISHLKTILRDAAESGNLIVDFAIKNGDLNLIVLAFATDLALLKEVFYSQVFDGKASDLTNDLFAPKPKKISEENGLKLAELLEELMPIFLDESVNKIGYKVKEMVKYFLTKTAEKPQNLNFHDVALMGYVINSGENKTDFDVLVADNLTDEAAVNFSQNCQQIEKGKMPEIFADLGQKIQFYCFQNYATWKLYKIFKQKIFTEKLNNVYYGFEQPLIKVLSTMEAGGIAVDKLKLRELSMYFDENIKILAREIYVLAGEELNIGSPKQLAYILFDKLSLQSGKKSKKTGAFSTNSEVLEELELEGHLIAGKILQWRQFSKLKSTYADALQNAIDPKTQRIHTTFSNLATTTGRLSSNNPNLQNIPIRTEEGKKIRSAFVAVKGCKLISADYSQIELRVLAHIAGIDALKQAFLQDKDIHTITAAQVFGVDKELVDKEMRRKAKAINFGIIYGISAFGLAKQLKINRGDAAKYIENYFQTYPGIQNYMHHYQGLARENGFVTTIIGRKCFIPTINSKNPTLRGLAERLAINAPIQGSAADIIKKAMIDFDAVLIEKNLSSKMVLQVHDELLIEAPENEVELVVDLLRKTMEKAIFLDVPLKVDIKISERWN